MDDTQHMIQWGTDGIVLIDGVRFEDPGNIEMLYTRDLTTMIFPERAVTCDACGQHHRCRPVAHNIEDAVERGLLRPRKNP